MKMVVVRRKVTSRSMITLGQEMRWGGYLGIIGDLLPLAKDQFAKKNQIAPALGWSTG
jgi:hypothetical protein